MAHAWAPERLKAAREAAGLRPEDAAAAIGVHRSTIYDAERGEHVLRADRAASLAALYGVPLDDFFTHGSEACTPSTTRGLANAKGRPHSARNGGPAPTHGG